jgi:hypothetical protein
VIAICRLPFSHPLLSLDAFGGRGKAFACPRNLESHMRLLESMNASFPPCGFLDLLLFMLVDES